MSDLERRVKRAMPEGLKTLEVPTRERRQIGNELVKAGGGGNPMRATLQREIEAAIVIGLNSPTFRKIIREHGGE